jgi:hypothetical protein
MSARRLSLPVLFTGSAVVLVLLAVELLFALLCLWVALRPATPHRHHATAPTKPKGALQ